MKHEVWNLFPKEHFFIYKILVFLFIFILFSMIQYLNLCVSLNIVTLWKAKLINCRRLLRHKKYLNLGCRIYFKQLLQKTNTSSFDIIFRFLIQFVHLLTSFYLIKCFRLSLWVMNTLLFWQCMSSYINLWFFIKFWKIS